MLEEALRESRDVGLDGRKSIYPRNVDGQVEERPTSVDRLLTAILIRTANAYVIDFEESGNSKYLLINYLELDVQVSHSKTFRWCIQMIL